MQLIKAKAAWLDDHGIRVHVEQIWIRICCETLVAHQVVLGGISHMKGITAKKEDLRILRQIPRDEAII